MGLSPLAIEQAAELLQAARRSLRPRGPLPSECAPTSLAEAYAIQERFIAGSGRPVGYKLGYTNPLLQRSLGIPGPVIGRLLEGRIHPSPAGLPAADFAVRVVETEVGLRLGRDLPARAAPYTLDEVTAAVASALPSFEVVDSRFANWRKLTPVEAVADNVLHSCWVHGSELSDFRELDLAGLEMTSCVNGREATRGLGANVLGSPLRALLWLVNELAQLGRGLAAGDWVTTGCCTDILVLAPGDVATADFGPLGTVRVEFPG